jgi:hypothetical protein
MVLLLFFSILAIVIGSGFFQRLDCAELPSLVEAHAVLENHQDIVRQIEGVNPGFIHLSLFSPEQCSQKAYLVVAYTTTQDKITIQEIFSQVEDIDDKRFFGVPYVLRNT